MFGKKQPKTIDISTGRLIEFKPIPLWVKAKSLMVADLDNGYDHYENVEFKVIDNATLIIRDNEKCIVYNLDKIIKYVFVEDDSPHTF